MGMASILEGELAATLADALTEAGLPYAVTVSRITPPDPIYGGEPTITPYPCQGWRDQYDLDTIDGTMIQRSDVRVFIIASSLSINPTTADTITIGGVSHAIINVGIDPAGTAWDIQARA
jgi:hypothetical protein